MKTFVRKRHVHHTHAAVNLSSLRKKHSCDNANDASDSSLDSLSPRTLKFTLRLITGLLPHLLPPRDEYLKAMGRTPQKERNRFQKFFHKLAIRIERACSSIESKKAILRASGNDFKKIG